MTWIKICGITTLDDALDASDAGANALGFVFYPKSPRHVTAETARSIVASLPQQIEKVGVFVNETADHVRDIAKHVGLTTVQLSGDESTDFSRTLFHCMANQGLANGSQRPAIFRAWPAKVFDVPAGQSVGWIRSPPDSSNPTKPTKANACTKSTSPRTATCFSKPTAFAPE